MRNFMLDFTDCIVEAVLGILLTLVISMLMYFILESFYKQPKKSDARVIVVKSGCCFTNCSCNRQFYIED